MEVNVSLGQMALALSRLWVFRARSWALSSGGWSAHRQAGKGTGGPGTGPKGLFVLIVQGTNAAIALGEATARAVQRIPDAHCNGDMHDALDYAADIKHKQKDFLTRQGVSSLMD